MHAPDSVGASVKEENGHCGAAAEVREAGSPLTLLVFPPCSCCWLKGLSGGTLAGAQGTSPSLDLSRTLAFSRPQV